jgi:tetratricopeptide (TPR) repeat protein
MPNDTPPVDFDQYLQTLQATLTQAREKGEESQTCLLLKKIGQIYLDKKDAPEALTCFEEALQIAKKMQDKDAEAQLFGLKGLTLKLMGNYDMALAFFQKSHSIAAALQREALMCDALLQIAVIESEMGRYEAAIEALNQAMPVAIQMNDTARKMRAASLLADACYALEDFDNAEKNYAIANEAARDSRNPPAECTFITKRGNVSLRKGEIKAAIEHYERALVIASEAEDRGAEINILGGLFRANALAGDAGLAVFYGERVVQMARDVAYFEAEIINLHALATFLVEQKEYAKALVHLETARLLAEKNQSPEWLLTILMTQAQTHYEAGENTQALEDFSQALRHAQQYSDSENEAEILGFISAILTDEKRWGEAWGSIQQAIAIAADLHDPQLLGNSQMLLAMNCREQKDIANAIQACEAAIQAYREIDAPELLAQANALLSELKE